MEFLFDKEWLLIKANYHQAKLENPAFVTLQKRMVKSVIYYCSFNVKDHIKPQEEEEDCIKLSRDYFQNEIMNV